MIFPLPDDRGGAGVGVNKRSVKALVFGASGQDGHY